MSLFDTQTTTGVSPDAPQDSSIRAGGVIEHRDAVSGSLAEEQVIPLIEEQLVVGKRTVETGTVRLHKHTEERTETVRTPLLQVTWQVEHVPVGQVIEDAPAIRQEGETTVYPVVEERLVVRREMVLVEEVRVTRATATVQHESVHRLKREEITEEREGIDGGLGLTSSDPAAVGASTMQADPSEAELPGFLDLRSRHRS